MIGERLDRIADYIDEIIGKYDFEKSFSLNPSTGSSMMDSVVSLDRFRSFVRNKNFCTFNHLSSIQERCNDTNMKKFYNLNSFIINEIYTFKLACDRVLQKFGNIMKDLVDCKHVEEKIIFEGLTGYLLIENDELILYCVYRYLARDGSHILFSEVKMSTNQNNKEGAEEGKKLECLKVIQVKQYDPKFAPLY